MVRKYPGNTLGWLIALLAVQFLLFAPNLGKGFVTDDFTWLADIVTLDKADFAKSLSAGGGFCRPLVGLSFALQYKIWGLSPLAYGYFNLILHLANILLVFLLLNSFTSSTRYALVVAFLFAFNAKGTHHAVGWISGRTSLLCTFFLLLTFLAFLQIRKYAIKGAILTAVCYSAALFSKEPAVVAPLFVFIFILFFKDSANEKLSHIKSRITGTIWPMSLIGLPLLVYLLVRFSTRAMTPLTAPGCYTYNLKPTWWMVNIGEYFIRAGLLDIYIILGLGLLILLFFGRDFKGAGINLSFILLGLTWFLVFLLPVLALPARSDLYTYFPQIGLHMASAVPILYLWDKIKPHLRPKKGPAILFAILILVTATAWFVYLYSKASANGAKATASHQFIRVLDKTIAPLPQNSHIYIIDRHHNEEYSPSRVVSYGFPALLKLYYPYMEYKGKILKPGNLPQQPIPPQDHYYTWHNNTLHPH